MTDLLGGHAGPGRHLGHHHSRAVRGRPRREHPAVAVDDLRGRGWIDADGALTEAGNIACKGIEQATDRLMGEPVKRLGDDGTARLIELVRPMVDQLANSGEVSGRWPPEHVMKPAEG